MSKMQKRIVFGSLLLAAMVGILILDGYLDHQTGMDPLGFASRPPAKLGEHTFAYRFPALPITAVMLVLLLVGWMEYGDLVKQAGYSTLHRTGLAAVSLLMLHWWLIHFVDRLGPRASGPAAWQSTATALLYFLPVFIVMIVFAGQMLRSRLTQPFERLGTTLLGVMWLGLGGAALLALRIEFGTAVLVIFLAAAKFTDIGAYFTGSFIGKHKMIPWLSPGKSWEGLVGGLATAAGISVLLAWLLLEGDQPPVWMWAIFGPVVGLAGQFGDLCESLLKRAAGAKDSGALVPEFGGVLDMLDSVLLSAPVATVVLVAMQIYMVQ
jgi:phosphatidate cytidylyltransferase